MNRKDLNELAQTVHAANAKWWTDLHTGERVQRDRKELLALVVSEYIEALEGIRKNLMDDKLPHRKMEEVEMADAVIRLLDFTGGYEIKFVHIPTIHWVIPENKGCAIMEAIEIVTEIGKCCEVSDLDARLNQPDAHYIICAITYTEEYCEKHGLDLWGAIEEKLEYNKTRADHTHEERLKEGGKKF